MAFDTIRAVVAQIELLEKINKKNIRFSITTNGSLLTDDIIHFLNEKKFSVLLSFDVLAQDINRHKGSYKFITSVLDKLLCSPNIELATNSVFTPETVEHLSSSAWFLMRKGVLSIDLSYSSLSPWNELSLSRLEAGLAAVRSRLIEHYKKKGNIPVSHFVKRDKSKLFACGAGFDRMAISPEGYLWGCCFFYDLARKQSKPLQENDYCFGSLDSYVPDGETIHRKKLKMHQHLKMEYFFTKKDFCKLCPDLWECAVCPVDAAFSTSIMGMIPIQACALRKVIRKQVKEFWRELEGQSENIITGNQTSKD